MVIINHYTFFNLRVKFSGVEFSSTEDKIFRKNNKPHRYYGPSWINIKTKHKLWYFNGVYFNSNLSGYSQKQFLKETSKLWLL